MTHKGLAKCSITECVKKHYARSYCKNHFYKFLRNGMLDRIKIIPRKTECIIPNCKNKFFCKDYCEKHYVRWNKYRDPYKVILKMSKNKICKIPLCNKKHLAKGYCMNHYRKYSNPKSSMKNDLFLEIAMNNVRKRDKNKCKWYNCYKSYITGDCIHVHHIFPRSEYPELKYLEEYMICYCKEHHKEWHKTRGDLCYSVL